MKRLVPTLTFLVILMLACNISGTVTPAPAADTSTPAPAVDTPTFTPAAVVPNVTCNELAFYLDPALASGYDCHTVPSTGAEGPEIHPQHTELTLQGYVLAGRFFTPSISVYSVQAYVALAPDIVNARVAALQALIGGGAMGSSALPLLGVFNAAQEVHVQYSVVPFVNGGGIRFLTQYSQYADPINNHEMFYTYQGLTSDGQYWVSAILPISNPILPENSDNPPGGVTWDEFNNNFDSYLVDISTQLNAQTGASFTPALDALDGLASSITIQP